MAQPDPSVTRIAGPWRHHDVHANGIRFQCVEALPGDGDDTPPTTRPLVILLHGFASFWWSWRHQLRGLSGARVVAVDLRGYGGSDKPPRGYDGWTLAGDTAGLIRALGHTSATLVGHADGGLVCWATAVLHSRMVQAIGLVSSPHPAALKRSVLACSAQRRALLPSLMGYQVPRWPEHLLTRHDAAELETLVRERASDKWVASEDFSETIAHLRQAIQIPSAAHSALMDRPIDVPLLHLRGDLDPYVLTDPVERSRRYASRGRFSAIPGAGHYAHEEAPAETNDHLQRLLAGL
jgi:pimeloyl-ACP methyl ester carboxylesterase